MLDRIIRFSLANRTLIIVAAALLIVAGAYTTATMEVDVFPDLNAPTVVVMTEATGMAPEEVERLVTFPIETAVNGAADVRRVRSTSSPGFSVVNIEFDWGTDIYRARQTVSEKLAVVEGEMPEGSGQPTLAPQSSILGEIMIISLTGTETTAEDLRTLADWTVRPRLLATGGVAQVAVIGGDIREYQILLNPGRMAHFGVSLDEAIDAVRGMNRNASGGTLYQYGNEYIIRGMLSTTDIEAMSQAYVKTIGGQRVTLGDIATVRTGAKTPRLGVASDDGRPAVIVTVTKQPQTGTIALTRSIDEALEELREELPEDVELSTDIFRQSHFIENSIGNVKKALLEGGFFVVIVLFIFLMNWRTTFISLVSIPLSILISLLVLRLCGLTINTMSLGGIAIAIGSLVDDSIVDVENVYKRLREYRNRSTADESQGVLPLPRKTTMDVVYNASMEVRLPMLSSTLIIVVSFLPLFFLSGVEGRLLVPLGISFVVSLFASMMVALTLTPVLSTLMLGHSENLPAREPWIVRGLKKGYDTALEWALGHKAPILGGTAALLALAIYVFAVLGKSFLPAFNEGSFTISVSTVPGISLDESDAIGRKVEEILLDIPEIKKVGRKTGRAELAEHSFGVNTSEFEVPFELGKRSKAELVADIRSRLAIIPGVNIEIGGPISHRIDEMLSGTQANIAIKLFGSDLGAMYDTGKEIKEIIEDIPGITDVNVEQQVQRPELRIIPRRGLLAEYGISLPEFREFVQVMMQGEVVSQVYEGNTVLDLTLKADDSSRSSIEKIGDMLIDAPALGCKVPLGQVADVVSSSGYNSINRENTARKLVVSCNVTGGELTKTVGRIRNRIEDGLVLPEDCHIEYGGQFESASRATKTISIVSCFALMVIIMLLYGQFHNLVQALVVLVNLPLSLIGGVLAMGLTDGIISIPAIIGFISLFGIATRNGMLLIDRYNSLRSGGMGLRESVITGSLDRLNPILMTAITSALALLPLALGGDLPGNEIQSPMAKVILGGLVTSTLLNAFIIPIMYILINGKKK